MISVTLLSSDAPTMPKAKYHCTEGTNSTRLRELALVQTWSTVGCHWVECGGRAKSGLSLPITKSKVGETKIITTMRMLLKFPLDKPLSLSLHLSISSPDSASRHSSCLVSYYDLLYNNLRQSNSAISAPIFLLKDWVGGKSNYYHVSCGPTNSVLFSSCHTP